MVARDVPLGARTLAGRTLRRCASTCSALHWQGSGRSTTGRGRSAGSWSAWRTADADTGPDRGSGERAARLARRQPRLDRRVATGCSSAARQRHAAARLLPLVASPPAPRRCRTLAVAGSPAIVPRALVGGRREDLSAQPRIRADAEARGRAPHGRHEPLHAGPGGGDRARHRGLPREGKRLERHRLQLPRRPLRHRLRGPRRRDRPERDRRARARVQHRHRRRGADRQLHARRRRRPRAGGARQAARLAPRRRATSTRSHRRRHLERQREFKAGKVVDAARDLGPPGHRPDRVPRQPAPTRCCRRSRSASRRRACRSSTPSPRAACSAAPSASRAGCRRRCRGRSP